MIYEVGKKVCAPSNDEVRIDFSDEGFTLIVKYQSPNASEKRAFKNGVPQFKIAIEDGIIFFLSRFDRMDWMDAPYHRDLSQNLTSFIRPSDGTGYSLHFMFIDASTGILLSQRMIGLSTEFSNYLFDAISQQSDVDIQSYDSQIAKIYATYSTNDLVERAVATN